jgi:hypothetical protein
MNHSIYAYSHSNREVWWKLCAISWFSLQVQQSRITSVLTEPQRALLSTISAGHDVIITAEKELGTKAQIPELGSDPVSKSKSVPVTGSDPASRSKVK